MLAIPSIPLGRGSRTSNTLLGKLFIKFYTEVDHTAVDHSEVGFLFYTVVDHTAVGHSVVDFCLYTVVDHSAVDYTEVDFCFYT